MLLSGKIIALSPGHGGSDPGRIGEYHTEKYYNARVVEALRSALLEQGAQPLTLRWDPDRHAVNEHYKRWGSFWRARYIRKWRQPETGRSVDLAISVHHNASISPSAHGCEVFYYSPKIIRARANDNHAMSKVIAESVALALSDALLIHNRGAKNRAFNMTKRTGCPAILTEACFLTNPMEEAWLNKLGAFGIEARAIVMGLRDAPID